MVTQAYVPTRSHIRKTNPLGYSCNQKAVLSVAISWLLIFWRQIDARQAEGAFRAMTTNQFGFRAQLVPMIIFLIERGKLYVSFFNFYYYFDIKKNYLIYDFSDFIS